MIKFIWLLLIITMLNLGNAMAPTTMCLGLITLSIVAGSLVSHLFFNWIFLSLMLIFLGGMMVVFVYVSALTGSDFTSPRPAIPASPQLILILPLLSNGGLAPPLYLKPSIMELFQFNKISVLLLLMVFLLMTLFIAVKNVQSFKGALKSFI